jgi:hypothetical protein
MKKQLAALKWEKAVNVILASLAGMGNSAYATGIIGGQAGNGDAYAAFVTFPSITTTPIANLPTSSATINTSAINSLGTALLGGQDSTSNGYATYVLPNGNLIPLSISFSGAPITTSAINSSGLGLIGGDGDPFNSNTYAAFVSPDGTVRPLSSVTSDTNYVKGVALNDSGVGLVGGEGNESSGIPTSVYVAYVQTDGTTLALSTETEFNIGGGSVAINSASNGIVGGSTFVDPNPVPYAALVFYNNGSPSLTVVSSLPLTEGIISSVAINNSGVGLIGGQDDGAANIYAAIVTGDAMSATATPLFSEMSPQAGFINSVALNDAGMGLIGGQLGGSDVYAAIVQPNMTVIPLFNTSIPGTINEVAIDQTGIGLIGGQTNSTAYAALVAPNGTITSLDIGDPSTILTTALNNNTNIFGAVTPVSTGPYASPIYTQLAAISALEAHFIEQNKLWKFSKGINIAQNDLFDSEELLADNRDDPLACIDKLVSYEYRPGARTKTEQSSSASPKNTIWVAPFGNFVHLNSEGNNPSINNQIGGVLLAYDRQGDNFLVGGSLGYAFNYIHYFNQLGHGKIQEEMACVYGAYYTEHFWFDIVAWGGVYQFWNKRRSLSSIISKAKSHGWIFSPHLEMASPWAMGDQELYYVEPFVMFDWVNSWLHGYTETGKSGFNLQVKGQYTSLLQSEAGIRFYEQFLYGWGRFCLEEKLSYVNQAPFHFHNVATSFVGSASSFPIAIGSSKVQNLASMQLVGCFVPKRNAYPYGGISLQVTANNAYQSYFVELFTGFTF